MAASLLPFDIDPDVPSFPGLVGRSPAMLDLFRRVRQFADSMAAVYILGETGTGKEQVARALHGASRRAARPFVPVNAAAISDELFDSELFGHKRGSFTGAVADRDGYVATADGGTLFIDEVADLSPRAQIKLLRFLQDKEYRRVGDSDLRRADVRVVVATHDALEERVTAGRFREDLLFRLDALKLVIPPLRDRGDDIVLLARHLLRLSALSDGKPAPALSPDAARALLRYRWPGNVRQLQTAMHRALVEAGPKGVLEASDLAPEILKPVAAADAPLAKAIEDFERDYVARTLAQCGGHRARAALRLGLSRQGLGLKMKRLGVATRGRRRDD
jgi:DNA-binding NtrC family response regulator